MKHYNDQAQRELEAFYKNLSAEDFARAKAFFSDSPVRSSNRSLSQSVSDNYELHAKVEYGDQFSVALGGATDGVTQRMAMENFLSKNIDSSCRFWVSSVRHPDKEYDFGEGDLKYFTSRVWPSVDASFGASRVTEIV